MQGRTSSLGDGSSTVSGSTHFSKTVELDTYGEFWYKIVATQENGDGSASSSEGPVMYMVEPTSLESEHYAINYDHYLYEGFRPVGATLAMVDTGLSYAVWNHFKTDPTNPYRDELTIEYWRYQEDEFGTPYFEDITGNTAEWNDAHGHGTWAFSAAVRIMRGGHYIMLEVPNDPVSSWMSVEGLTHALYWLITNRMSPGLVITLSSAWPSASNQPLAHISTLFENDVCFFASKGNDDSNEYRYPCDYGEVMAIGGCFDSDAPTSAKIGQRWLNEPGDGSNYAAYINEYLLLLTAPAHSIQVRTVDNVVANAEGTSFSAPITAAAACVLLQRHKELLGSYMLTYEDEPNYRNSVRMAALLRDTAELTAAGYLPTINYNPHLSENPLDWEYERGYGILDFFDAYKLLFGL
jgi:hypothetical protein